MLYSILCSSNSCLLESMFMCVFDFSSDVVTKIDYDRELGIIGLIEIERIIVFWTNINSSIKIEK